MWPKSRCWNALVGPTGAHRGSSSCIVCTTNFGFMPPGLSSSSCISSSLSAAALAACSVGSRAAPSCFSPSGPSRVMAETRASSAMPATRKAASTPAASFAPAAAARRGTPRESMRASTSTQTSTGQLSSSQYAFVAVSSLTSTSQSGPVLTHNTAFAAATCARKAWPSTCLRNGWLHSSSVASIRNSARTASSSPACCNNTSAAAELPVNAAWIPASTMRPSNGASTDISLLGNVDPLINLGQTFCTS
mmetsp:Transcript_82901/g.160202  ORF Transcript_82901/g.160202 Transcript_82901/m.160202 type:complete len:249 (+) Transcript_82901:477-1223(+)